MKRTLTLTVQVEVDTSGPQDQEAIRDVLHETDKALDYWFGHTDRAMTNRGVSIKNGKA